MTTCGERFGHRNGKGEPCGQRVRADAALPCPAHRPGARVQGRPREEVRGRAVEITEDRMRTLGAYLPHHLIADWLGVSEDTLSRRFREDPELLRAYKEGAAQMVAGITESVVHMARGLPDRAAGPGHFIREPAGWAACFLLKTRGGLRETERVELTGAGGGPVRTEDVTLARQQIAGRIEALIHARSRN